MQARSIDPHSVRKMSYTLSTRIAAVPAPAKVAARIGGCIAGAFVVLVGIMFAVRPDMLTVMMHMVMNAP